MRQCSFSHNFLLPLWDGGSLETWRNCSLNTYGEHGSEQGEGGLWQMWRCTTCFMAAPVPSVGNMRSNSFCSSTPSGSTPTAERPPCLRSHPQQSSPHLVTERGRVWRHGFFVDVVLVNCSCFRVPCQVSLGFVGLTLQFTFSSPSQVFVSALVSLGCHNNVPRTGELKPLKCIFSVLECGSSRLRCWQSCFFLRPLFFVYRWPSSSFVFISSSLWVCPCPNFLFLWGH